MANTWKIWANRTGRIEAKHLPKVKRVINKTYKAAAYMVRTAGPISAANMLRLKTSDSDLIPVLRNIYTDGGKFGAAWTFGELNRSLKKRTGQKAANIGRNLSWIAEVLNYLKINLLQFAANITATTRNDILKIIDAAVQEGKGAEEIAREIEASGLPLARARVIARTEVITAVNVGHTVGAKSFPFEVNKRWSAAKDRRTRHSHVLANGKTVGEYEAFKIPIYKGRAIIGYDEMKFPGDPGAHASNRINCRCRVVYTAIRDAAGKPIPRKVSSVLTF